MAERVLKSAYALPSGVVVKAGEKVEIDESWVVKDGKTSVLDDVKKRGLVHEGGPTEQQKLRRRIARTSAGQNPDDDDNDFPEEVRVERQLVFLPVTPSQYDALSAAGLGTPEAIAVATDEQLLDVEGIGESTVDRIRKALKGAEE